MARGARRVLRCLAWLSLSVSYVLPKRARRPRAAARPAAAQSFDWAELVTQEQGLDFIRLRVLIEDADAPDTRRPPFFNARSFPSGGPGADALAGLENLAAEALQHVALQGDERSGKRIDKKLGLLKATASGDAGLAAFADAVGGVVQGGTVLLPGAAPVLLSGAVPGYADAFARFAAEVEAARADEDFCLSLLDRRAGALPRGAVRGVALAPLTATRALNDASNELLRAAAYGARADVGAARRSLVALAGDLPALEGYEEACDAYLRQLVRLASAEAEYSPERAAVEDASFATFYQKGAASSAPAEALGDAYSVALQRFLGELTRRGALTSPVPELAPDFSEDRPAALAGLGNENPIVSKLNFDFAEWEMALRRKLALKRDDSSGLHPSDFVGVWRLTLVDDAVSAAGGPLLAVTSADVRPRLDEPYAEVEFGEGGSVVQQRAPAGQQRPPRWRVRPGPAHLDTCEFELDVDGGRVAFCGYVDRGQRIESRFSRRPIRVSGFAFEKGDGPRRLDAAAQPSGQFRMQGPAEAGSDDGKET